MLKNVRRDRSPAGVMVTNEMKVDYWFAPKHVPEVRGSEIAESLAHTCNWAEEEKRGLASRFPRSGRWRPEKILNKQPLYERLQTCFLPKTR